MRVQTNADAFSGSQSRRGTSQAPRSLGSRKEGNRRSEACRQSHLLDGERVARPQRKRTRGGPEMGRPGGRVFIDLAKAT